MDEVLKIIIADDNYALVDFMKKILEEDKRFEVVVIATNDEEEIYPKRIMIIGDNQVKYYMIILSYGRTLISKI
ncbi:MAG: hypothetical protein BHW07_00560 [Clostridium sp. CAG_433_25_7]|nr:MAG: hypothetical protein BHW07_00560 [Clostridium sp. CAG_433_25_7]